MTVPLLYKAGEGEEQEVKALAPNKPRHKVATYTIAFSIIIKILRFTFQYIF